MEPPAPTTANGQVVVGDIPALRPGFQPRPALMAQLNQASQRPPMVLTGAWGTGKTQLAAAYARARLADRWRLIAWVSAGDNETLLAGLAAVADAAGLSVGGSRPGAADAGQAVRHWLEADGSRGLLVFDGVEDPGLLRPFVPAAGEARVLITAAREPIAELGTSIPVDVFSAEEALALLDGRTALADDTGASAVAAELGHLPLALDQAAAVIAGQRLGYAAYLAKLRALSAGGYLVRWKDGGGSSRFRRARRRRCCCRWRLRPLPTRSVCALGSWRSRPCCHRLRSAATCCMLPGRRAHCLAVGAGWPCPWWIRQWSD